MITRQHTAIFFWALLNNMNEETAIEHFRKEIPWAVLPDGIRAYIGPRQAGHFEMAPNWKVAWMKYPSEEVLKKLTKESAKEQIDYYVPDAFPKCVIGEATQLWMFDKNNAEHKHYHAIRTHLVQDVILDNVLRDTLIDHSHRFEDKFTVRFSGKEIDGAELRKQVALFEELGFIHLLGRIYEETGMILDSEWFDRNVYTALCEAYPADLAENTYKYMRFSPELQERISSKRFELTQEEIESVYMAEHLIDTLDKMYFHALVQSRGEMSQ